MTTSRDLPRQDETRIEPPQWLKDWLARTPQPKILWQGKKTTLVLMSNRVYLLGPMHEAVEM